MEAFPQSIPTVLWIYKEFHSECQDRKMEDTQAHNQSKKSVLGDEVLAPHQYSLLRNLSTIGTILPHLVHSC